MIPSVVNPKVIHAAVQATIDPYDSGMDALEPETPEYWGNNRGCLASKPVPQLTGLARTLKKFGIPDIIGVLDKRRVNGYYRCSLLCSDGSILEDDMEPEELKALPEVKKGSALEEWVGGGYPTDPIMETAFFKSENKDELSSCVLCGRTLTAPLSVKRHVGPECYKRITPSGNTFMQGDEVAQGLISASEVYSEERFRKWIIKAVLTLDAPLPAKTLEWLGKEHFGYNHKPSLYYVDASSKLNVIEVKKKRLTHRQITSLSTCETDLDYRAWRIFKTDALANLVVVEVTDPGKFLRRQWFIYEANRRVCVYEELNGKRWCNCHQPDCAHIKAVQKFERGR